MYSSSILSKTIHIPYFSFKTSVRVYFDTSNDESRASGRRLRWLRRPQNKPQNLVSCSRAAFLRNHNLWSTLDTSPEWISCLQLLASRAELAVLVIDATTKQFTKSWSDHFCRPSTEFNFSEMKLLKSASLNKNLSLEFYLWLLWDQCPKSKIYQGRLKNQWQKKKIRSGGSHQALTNETFPKS